MSRPKICIFTETYYPVIGGGETQARALAEGLVAHGFSVLVITRRSDRALKRVESYGSIRVYRLRPVGRAHWKKWGLLFTSVPLLIRLRRHYDLIFVSGFRVIGLPGVWISRLLGKACILKADSLGELSGDFFAAGLRRVGLRVSSRCFRLFLAGRNNVLRRADAFVAISSEVAAELTRHGVHPSLIQAIPNSVDTRLFRPVDRQTKQALRANLNLPPADKIVMYTGRLVSYKGLPLLLRVWRDIQAHHRHVRLLLVGAGGLDIHNCEAALKAYVIAQGLQESVQFTGAVRNVQEYLQAADLFVFPTESEAFGISLIEAMACSLPVIATQVGGVKDILTHGQNGLVAQAGNAQQLYEALDTILHDSTLSTALGKAARQTVLDRYSTQRVVQNYKELFRQLANPGQRPEHTALSAP